MLHRARDLLMRQRTQVINALRAHLAELGITAAQETAGLKELLKIIASDEDERLPADAHASLVVLAAELQAMQTLVGSLEKRIMAGIGRTRRAGGWRPSRASGSSERPRLRRRSRIRRHSGRGAILRPGSGSCRAKIQPAASRSSGQSPSRATAICDAFSSLALTRSCATRSRTGKISLAHATPGATTLQGRGGGARQQDGAHGLGTAGPQGHLPGA
jgi:hypothetical protein